MENALGLEQCQKESKEAPGSLLPQICVDELSGVQLKIQNWFLIPNEITASAPSSITCALYMPSSIINIKKFIYVQASILDAMCVLEDI